MKFEIKNPFAKKEIVSDKERENIKKSVRDTQREFEKYSRLYESEMAKLRDFVRQAADIEKDSAEYKHIQQQAMACKKKADGYEKSMKTAYEVLSKNQDFEMWLEHGMTVDKLNKLIPDPEKAEELMEKLSDGVQNLQDKIEDLNQIGEEYMYEIGNAISGTYDQDSFEFDSLVAKENEKRIDKKTQPESQTNMNTASTQPQNFENISDEKGVDNSAIDKEVFISENTEVNNRSVAA